MVRLVDARCVCAALLIALLPAVGGAEVIDASPTGFTSKSVVEIAAPAPAVYAALVKVGTWWDPEHTYSGEANNLTIDARPGGCFCETWSKGSSVQHLEVIYADPPRAVRMTGGLGPLQELAVVGTLTWTLTEQDGRTRLEQTYAVGGYRAGGLQEFAPVVDAVLRTQIERLKRLVETGRPSGR
jgi:uncharacterized protein YndB with AHSA1/START domain